MSILIKNTYYNDVSPILTGKESPAPYKASCSITTINDFWKVFDGKESTYFRTNISTSVPFTATLDYGEGNAKAISAYILLCSYNTTFTMNSWKFEGSNDGNIWDVLDTRSNITWTTNTKQEFTFYNMTAYRYYRFYISKKNGTNSVSMNTVQLLEEESTKLEFRKVKKDNLPSTKTDGIDTLYFTENGSMYLTNKDGELVQCGGEPNGVPTLSSEEKNAIQSKDDGLYVKDLSETIKNLNIAQHTVNIELDHCELKMSSNYTPVANEYLPFNIVSGNMKSETTGFVKLKAGRSYLINICMGYKGATTPSSISYSFYNKTTDTRLQSFNPYGGTGTEHELSYAMSLEYTPDEDCEVGWVVTAVYTSDTINAGFTICTINEIGRMITVDPVEYVNNDSGIEDTPVGHIIPYMGTSAPAHYLACDGAEYNITDYPNLVKHFTDNYGIANYFGGDGTSTFAVPKYSYIYESVIPIMSGYSENGFVVSASSEYSTLYPAWKAFTKTANSDQDSWATLDGQTTGWVQIKCPVPILVNKFSITSRYTPTGVGTTYPIDFSLHGSNDGITWDELKVVTNESIWKVAETRYYDVPNNPQYLYYRLSVTKSSNTTYMDIANFDLYHNADMRCIKYEPTYYMKNVYDADNVFSTSEQIIGKWIDGKALYQRTFKLNDCAQNSQSTLAIDNYSEIDAIVNIFGTAKDIQNAFITLPLAHTNTEYALYVDVYEGNIRLISSKNSASNVYITIRYTKTTYITS